MEIEMIYRIGADDEDDGGGGLGRFFFDNNMHRIAS